MLNQQQTGSYGNSYVNKNKFHNILLGTVNNKDIYSSTSNRTHIPITKSGRPTKEEQKKYIDKNRMDNFNLGY